MRTIFKGDLLILMPESRDEAAALAHWREGREGQPLALLPAAGKGAALRFIDPKAEPSSHVAAEADGGLPAAAEVAKLGDAGEG